MDQPRPRFSPWCARRILVIVATKIDGNMLHWPICSEFAQCCCKFLNRFQKLATCCSTANIAKNCPQRGVTLEQFFAQHRIIASWRCKLTSVTSPLGHNTRGKNSVLTVRTARSVNKIYIYESYRMNIRNLLESRSPIIQQTVPCNSRLQMVRRKKLGSWERGKGRMANGEAGDHSKTYLLSTSTPWSSKYCTTFTRPNLQAYTNAVLKR